MSDKVNDERKKLKEKINKIMNHSPYSKFMPFLIYLVIWVISLICFRIPGDECGMLYSILFLILALPISTFVLSFWIGLRNYWGKLKWFTSIGFGIMYMLAEHFTFSADDPSMIFNFTVCSLMGMAIGYSIYYTKK